MSKLAYFVEDDPNEHTGYIHFFEGEEAANAYQHGCGEDYTLYRTPECEYSTLGYIPSEKWMECPGNWLECHYCYKLVDQGKWDYEKDTSLTPVYTKHILYCSQECVKTEMKDLSYNKKRLNKAIEKFNKLYPFCTPIIHKYFYTQTSTIIKFTFHGGEGTWNGELEELYIAPIHLKAFNKLENKENIFNSYISLINITNKKPT